MKSMPSEVVGVFVGDITVGDKTRTDLGDIEGLAASIARIGLLQPIVVDVDGRLIAGVRRLAAFDQPLLRLGPGTGTPAPTGL